MVCAKPNSEPERREKSRKRPRRKCSLLEIKKIPPNPPTLPTLLKPKTTRSFFSGNVLLNRARWSLCSFVEELLRNIFQCFQNEHCVCFEAKNKCHTIVLLLRYRRTRKEQPRSTTTTKWLVRHFWYYLMFPIHCQENRDFPKFSYTYTHTRTYIYT